MQSFLLVKFIAQLHQLINELSFFVCFLCGCDELHKFTREGVACNGTRLSEFVYFLRQLAGFGGQRVNLFVLPRTKWRNKQDKTTKITSNMLMSMMRMMMMMDC